MKKLDIKIGSRVVCELYGNGVVTEINKGEKYPIEVELESDGSCMSYTEIGESQGLKGDIPTLKINKI